MSGSEFSQEASEHYRGTARPPHVEVPPADDLRIGPNPQGANNVYGRAPFPSEARTTDRPVSEPRVRQPNIPRVSENAGRAAMKGAPEATRPSSDAAFNDAIWGHAQSQKDGLETKRPTKDLVSQKDVLVGEIFEGEVDERRGQAFDKPLSKEKQVLLVGKHAKDTDGSAKEVLKSHMEEWHEAAERLEKQGKQSPRFEVLGAHFKPGFQSSLEESAPEWYHARKSFGVEGFLRVLPPNQLAEATARAATDGDPSAFANTFDVTKTVAKALQTEERDPQTKELVDVKSPLASELREGMQFYRDGRYDPEDPKAFPEAEWKLLTEEKIDRLDLAKNSAVMERNGPARDLATSFLEAAFDPDNPKVARTNNANTDRPMALAPQDAGNRVRVTHVGANGDGYQGENLAKILAYALPFAMSSNSSLGNPNAVLLTGIEHAPVDAIRRILEKCQERDIPVIMTASHVTQEMAEVLSGSAMGVSQVTPATAEVLSQMLGEARREFTKSASVSWSTGRADAEDEGVSASHDTNPAIPTSVSKSGSRNTSTNEGIDISYTTEVDHNARRVSTGEFGLVQRGQMAVFGSGGELHGLHDTATRAWMTQFPPADIKPYAQILQAVQERLQVLRAEARDSRQRPAIRESTLGASAIEGARGAVAERPSAVFTVPSPNGRSSGEYRMPVMSNASTNRSGLPDIRGLMSGNGQRVYDERALYDLKRGYEKLRHQSYKKDPVNFGQYCVQRYVMALRSGELGNVSLVDWVRSVKASGYVNRHLRLGGYDVNDPGFWDEWFRDHPNCANWAQEYSPSTPWGAS